jgi:5-formyltetrahydrofolate cyclo-ligase
VSDDPKTAVRAQLKSVRATLSAPQRHALSSQLCEHVHALPGRPHAIWSGFLPIRDEIDPQPLMARLAHRGHSLCLPIVSGRDVPLRFRSWHVGDAMATAAWGLREPKPDQPEVDPDVLLVPLLAFDGAGNRLGYGAGYYDRTIASLKTRKAIVTIGLAFDIQRIDAVPHSGYDEPLDWVLTPSGLIDCRRTRAHPPGL